MTAAVLRTTDTCMAEHHTLAARHPELFRRRAPPQGRALPVCPRLRTRANVTSRRPPRFAAASEDTTVHRHELVSVQIVPNEQGTRQGHLPMRR
jgi:hypothetical protein